MDFINNFAKANNVTYSQAASELSRIRWRKYQKKMANRPVFVQKRVEIQGELDLFVNFGEILLTK